MPKKTSRTDLFYKTYGKYFVSPTVLMVPRASKRIVQRLPTKKLKNIDNNIAVAREKIFIFLNEFYRKHQEYLAGRLEFEPVDIHSKKLIKIFGSRKYIKALDLLYDNDLLIRPTKTSYKVGEYSKPYKLENDMIYKPFVKYTILCDTLKEYLRSLSADQIRIIQKSPIAMSVVKSSHNITLPNELDLQKHAKKLISVGWSNKGKKLAFIKDKGKNDKNIKRLKDSGVPENSLPKFYYVEKGIMLFKSLTENGYMLPKIGIFKSGGRVTTSFTLMPKWIRIALLLNNNKTVGVDYSALHPNIASKLWGNGTYINHQIIADFLGISIHTAKLEHLKFFNTTSNGLKKMTIYSYYKKNQSELLKNLIDTKKSTYKRTSALMFKAEVEIMTEVFSRLNKMGLSGNLIYVYDEVVTNQKYAKVVQQVMEQVANDLNYKLKAKIG